MSLEQLSAIAQILAAAVGIPSLIFVGIQLNLATRAVRASSSQAHAAMYHALTESIVDNSTGFASIWREGLSGTAGLSDEERVRFFAFISSLLRFFESARIQWLRKQLYREHWRAIEQQAQYLAVQPGVKEFWRERRHWHCMEFQAWFNALIELQNEASPADASKVPRPT
jgi:hypothetical protein